MRHNSKIDPEKLYWAFSEAGEIRLLGQAILDITQSGPNDESVAHWAPKVREQWEKDNFTNRPTAESIREDLSSAGAWDDEGLKDDEQNWLRFVWTCAWSVAKESDPDCSEPLSVQEVLIKVRWMGRPEERKDFCTNLCEHIVDTFNDDGSIVECGEYSA